MSNINLDIKSIRDNIQSTREMTKNFGDSSGKYLAMLTNVDTCWNDNLTDSFIKTVNVDQESLEELIAAINKQINLSSDFCDELQSAIGGYFDITNLYNIKYITSTTDRALEVLDVINERIASIKSNLASLSIPYSSSNSGVISNLLSDVDTSIIRDTKQRIGDAVTAINHTINNSKEKALMIEKYEMDSNTIKWMSSTVTPELSRSERHREKVVGFNKATTKANMERKTVSGQPERVSFKEDLAKTDLNEIKKSKVEQVSFNGSKSTATLESTKLQSPNSNFGFTSKTSGTSLKDINVDQAKQYDYHGKENNIDFKTGSISKVNTYNSINDHPAKANINDFNVPLESNNYSYSENISNNDLKTEKVNVSKDYLYNENSVNADLQGVNVNINSDYSMNGNNVTKAQTSDANVNVKSDYGLNDDNISRVQSSDINVSINPNYNINGDNITRAKTSSIDLNMNGKDYYYNDNNI